MIKVYFSIGTGNVELKEFTSEASFESWCTRMADEYGFNGWEIHHTRYA
jgi:chitinase